MLMNALTILLVHASHAKVTNIANPIAATVRPTQFSRHRLPLVTVKATARPKNAHPTVNRSKMKCDPVGCKMRGTETAKQIATIDLRTCKPLGGLIYCHKVMISLGI